MVKHEQQVHADRESADRGLLEAIETVRQRLAELKETEVTETPDFKNGATKLTEIREKLQWWRETACQCLAPAR